MKISDWFGSIDTGEPPTYKLSGNQRIAELEAELQEARRLLELWTDVNWPYLDGLDDETAAFLGVGRA